MGLNYARGVFLLLAVFALAITSATADTNFFAQSSTTASCPDPVPADDFPDLGPVALGMEVVPGTFASCSVKAINDGQNASQVNTTFNIQILDGETLQTIRTFPPLNRRTLKNGFANVSTNLGFLGPEPREIIYAATANSYGLRRLDIEQLHCWIGRRTQCTRDRHTMCLSTGGGTGRNRMKMNLDWIDPFNGEERRAVVQNQGTNSGTFLFDPLGDDLLVRVLNGCNDPSFNSFWVFASGLTNVEFTLTVEDTRSGQVRQYFNSSGMSFPPVGDYRAFSTCP